MFKIHFFSYFIFLNFWHSEKFSGWNSTEAVDQCFGCRIMSTEQRCALTKHSLSFWAVKDCISCTLICSCCSSFLPLWSLGFFLSCIASLASYTSSSLAASASSFSWSLCSTFSPFRSSLPSLVSEVQPVAGSSQESTSHEKSGESFSDLHLTVLPSAQSLWPVKNTALVFSLLCCPSYLSGHSEPWLSGTVWGVITSGHLETRNVYLIFRGSQNCSWDLNTASQEALHWQQRVSPVDLPSFCRWALDSTASNLTI